MKGYYFLGSAGAKHHHMQEGHLQYRERQVVCREHQAGRQEVTMKQQADKIVQERAILQQLQMELLNQYNTVIASLPRLEDR